jgi:hypothetical protein
VGDSDNSRLVLTLSLLMSYIYLYMELLVKPEILTSYNIITPWPQSASELYRQNGRRRSAKVVPTVSG